jgi:recombination protein RecA
MKKDEEKEVSTNLENVMANIEKQFGDGSIMRLGKAPIKPMPVVSTGSLAIDLALGVGGFPRGRVIEIYGPECIDSESFVQYDVRHQNGTIANSKGGTIKRLYERFHKLPHDGDSRGCYKRIVTESAEFFAPSVNVEGRIIKNKIKNVMFAGQKPSLIIRTEQGYQIVAGLDHKFLSSLGGYIQASSLQIGDALEIHNNTPYTSDKPKDSKKGRVWLYVKQHPIAGIKKIHTVINRATGETQEYVYRRLPRSRAVVEAQLNGMSLGEFIDMLNSESSLDNLKFLSRDQHVHHRDENPTNDELNNLEVLSSSKHGQLHATERHNNLRFKVVPDRISSIEDGGLREMYDIQMEAPLNNYIAEHFVVHNSGGKTTLTLHCIAEAQKIGGQAAFIDAEHALDPAYAKKLGVDTDNLLISQPDNGEQALEITEQIIKSGKIDIIVVDSVAALVPKAELEGEMGDPQMGLQARLMSQALRKLTGITNQTKTILIFINQIREKIGVMFGNPETTTGGRALKFYSSVRVDIRKIQALKNGDVVYGADTKVKIVKNKVSTPFKEAQVQIIYGEGISGEADLLRIGETNKVIEKSGSWYSYKGERIGQGFDGARRFLLEHSEIRSKIDKDLRSILFKKG